jgi:hypothetical protein
MTPEELRKAKIILQRRWKHAIELQELAKGSPKAKTQAKYALGVALGYMYAIDDMISLSDGIEKAYKTVTAWRAEVEKQEGIELKD